MNVPELFQVGGQSDPFSGNTWQSFFQSIARSVTALATNFNSGQLLISYTVADLPTAIEGALSYATNGRKVGEGAGAGTGVPVYFSSGSWRVFSTDAPVAA